MKLKASFTVEAALVCTLLCLFLCGIIRMTLDLYSKVDLYTEELQSSTEENNSAAELIRIEAVTEEFLWEVETYAGRI